MKCIKQRQFFDYINGILQLKFKSLLKPISMKLKKNANNTKHLTKKLYIHKIVY